MSQMANSFGFFESIMLLRITTASCGHLVTARQHPLEQTNYVGTISRKPTHIATALPSQTTDLVGTVVSAG